MERNIPAALIAVAAVLGETRIDRDWLEEYANVLLDDSSQSVVITLEELDERHYRKIKDALRSPDSG